MEEWTVDNLESVLISVFVLVVDVTSSILFSDMGGDFVGYLYSRRYLQYCGFSLSIVNRLNLAWWILSSATLQFPSVRLIANGLLVLSSVSGDVLLRLPWLVIVFLELLASLILVMTTWIILLFNGWHVQHTEAIFFLVLLLMIYIRLSFWEVVCWFAMNNAVIEVMYVYMIINVNHETRLIRSSNRFISPQDTTPIRLRSFDLRNLPEEEEAFPDDINDDTSEFSL